MSAHDAERHEDAALFGRHAGNYRVHRAFARRDPVRMARSKNETLAAVMEEDARLRAHESAA